MRVTDSGNVATDCITANPTSKYTFGDAKSGVKYIVYDVAAFGSKPIEQIPATSSNTRSKSTANLQHRHGTSHCNWCCDVADNFLPLEFPVQTNTDRTS
jgi:hypothetical protein